MTFFSGLHQILMQVAEQTALAISHRCCSTLYSLDLSFCREMTDEALGLIVDSCSSLRFLKLFGCTQVGVVFIHFEQVFFFFSLLIKTLALIILLHGENIHFFFQQIPLPILMVQILILKDPFSQIFSVKKKGFR